MALKVMPLEYLDWYYLDASMALRLWWRCVKRLLLACYEPSLVKCTDFFHDLWRWCFTVHNPLRHYKSGYF